MYYYYQTIRFVKMKKEKGYTYFSVHYLKFGFYKKIDL